MMINLSLDEVHEFARRYREKEGGKLLEDDQSLQESFKDARLSGHITPQQLRDVAKWKSGERTLPHLTKNAAEEVKECSAVAFAAQTDRLRIHALLALDGISWPTASAILHFVFPGRFPILDVRAMGTVGKIRADSKQSPNYTLPLWTQYAKLCRETAERYGVTLRDLDRALWMWDAEGCNRSPYRNRPQ